MDEYGLIPWEGGVVLEAYASYIAGKARVLLGHVPTWTMITELGRWRDKEHFGERVMMRRA